MRRPLALAGLLVLATTCTRSDLYTIPDPEVPVARMKIEGQICAPANELVYVPYRILFVIDTSSSMQKTDPASTGKPSRRKEAVLQAINRARCPQVANPGDPKDPGVTCLEGGNNGFLPGVKFGIITFSDQPMVQTFGFTSDYNNSLYPAMTNIDSPFGSTNYSDTMIATTDFVLNDLKILTPLEASNARYYVFWLTDGRPTVGIVDPPDLPSNPDGGPATVMPTAMAAGVRYLMTAVKGYKANLTFNTVFLHPPAVPTGPEIPDAGVGDGGGSSDTKEDAIAKLILEQMAIAAQEAGSTDSTFTDVVGNDTPVTFDVEVRPLYRSYKLSTLIAYNRNTVLGEFGPEPDSDGDGLLDIADNDAEGRTTASGDPTAYDRDGDGYCDGVEDLQSTTGRANPSDPLKPAEPCPYAKDLDTDGDRLTDCEEGLLGTRPNDPDTDGDGLLDGIEVMAGSLPLTADPTVDSDRDGIGDNDEVLVHTHPRIPTTREFAAKWGYQYSHELIPPEVSKVDVNCYDIVIGNIAMIQTQAHAGKAEGTNETEIIVGFTPTDSDRPITFLRATKEGRFLPPLLLEPASSKFDFQTFDLHELTYKP